MKISSLLGASAFFLLSFLPASLQGEELYESEFDLGELPQIEEESSWEFSVGIEGVFGKGLTDGSSQIFIESRYFDWEKFQWIDTSYVEKHSATPQGSFGGVNFRLNWIASEPIEETTKIFPEFYILFGLLVGEYDCEALAGYDSVFTDINITFLQVALGGNLHYPLSEQISVFGGVRFGGSSLLVEDDFSSWGGVYGIGSGINFCLGRGGSSIRFGVDYLVTTVDGESEHLSLSESKWLLFSLGYNIRF